MIKIKYNWMWTGGWRARAASRIEENRDEKEGKRKEDCWLTEVDYRCRDSEQWAEEGGA